MINVAIVEDEKSESSLLAEYLTTYTKDHGVEFHTVIYENPITFLTGYKSNFDLVLMDIEMPDINGMETARKMREIDKTVTLIFVTNMAQFAIKGYEVDAFDFMVKPVSYFDFALKLGRAIERIRSRKEIKIPIAVEDSVKYVTPLELMYVEIIKHRLLYHTTEGVFETYGTMKKIEPTLLAADFAKCNNCYLVNLRYVTGIKGYAVTVGGDELQISHPKRREFVKALNDYLGEKF